MGTGADGLTDEQRARAERLAEEQEAAQVAAWERCAAYLRQIAAGTPGILDSRSAALILAHEDAIRGHLVALADMAEGLDRALDCLRRDLEGARAEVLQGRAEAEALRAERDAALARLTAEPSEGRGVLVIELGVSVR